MGEKIVLSVFDYKRQVRFQIIEYGGYYSLVFLEWAHAGEPWDFVDPIKVDSSYEECLKELYNILKGGK